MYSSCIQCCGFTSIIQYNRNTPLMKISKNITIHAYALVITNEAVGSKKVLKLFKTYMIIHQIFKIFITNSTDTWQRKFFFWIAKMERWSLHVWITCMLIPNLHVCRKTLTRRIRIYFQNLHALESSIV